MTNKNVASEMRSILDEFLSPVELEIVNESHLHAGHSGDNGTGESHFKLMIVSSAFENKTRVERHRIVYDLLKDLMHNPIHALSIMAKTPGEKT